MTRKKKKNRRSWYTVEIPYPESTTDDFGYAVFAAFVLVPDGDLRAAADEARRLMREDNEDSESLRECSDEELRVLSVFKGKVKCIAGQHDGL